jgi:hypothetical protein
MSKTKENRHHVTPSSRGGTEEDIAYWDRTFHELFHRIFWNMTPKEQHEFLDEINRPKTLWSATKLSELRRKIISKQ